MCYFNFLFLILFLDFFFSFPHKTLKIKIKILQLVTIRYISQLPFGLYNVWSSQVNMCYLIQFPH